MADVKKNTKKKENKKYIVLRRAYYTNSETATHISRVLSFFTQILSLNVMETLFVHEKWHQFGVYSYLWPLQLSGNPGLHCLAQRGCTTIAVFYSKVYNIPTEEFLPFDN